MAEYKLSYTAAQINAKLGKIDSLAAKSELPTKTSELANDSGFTTKQYVDDAIANIDIPEVDLTDYALKSEIPTDYLKTIPAEYITESELAAKKYLTSYTETDPTVPAWAKASTKPSYTKSEVGLGNVDNVKQYSASNPPPYPVTKVNNKTGAVTLSASDVGADASGTASSIVSTHNTAADAHADIRGEISSLSSEIVDIKSTAVLYTPQTLTDAQKAQARNNMGIGAPAYIVAEAERVAKAVQTTRTAKSLVFPVMTDFHLFDGNSAHDASLLSAQYAGMGVDELKKRMHIDFAAYLGDYSWGADNHTAQQIMKDITAAKKTTITAETEIWCVGNHDLNYGKNRDRLLTLDEVYSHIGANSDGVKPFENIERGYGYLDFENQKIRVIYLNTCDASDWAATDGATARSEWISPTQIQWLADTALNFTNKTAPSEWGIVIMSHHPLHYGYNCFDNTMKLLEAYKDGKSGSVACAVNEDANVNVAYDFSGAERAEILCNIHGHNHNCGYSQISSTTRTGSTAVAPWLWRFCIPNICANRHNSGYENFTSNETALANYGEVDESGNPVYWTKETGTAKATSFCVVTIDRKNKKVYAHIFGAGKDRVMYYGEEEIVTYSVTNTLTNCTNSNTNTAVVEGSAYSTTITANRGYVLDSVVVTMGGEAVTVTNGVINIASVTGDIVITANAVEEIVNILSLATSAPGGTEIYGNGAGYVRQMRWSSSSKAPTQSGAKASHVMTGFWPYTWGDTFYVKGMSVGNYSFVVGYTGSDYSAQTPTSNNKSGQQYITGPDDNGVYTIVGNTGWTHLALSVMDIDGNTIITKNQPIE